MKDRHIIFVPGKNPKPPAKQHRHLLWRTLLEGVRRAEPKAVRSLQRQMDNFKLIAWNHLYYHETKNIDRDLPWIRTLINTPGPSEQDVYEANDWHRRLDRALFAIADMFPFIIRILPKTMRMTAEEIRRYFQNEENIACDIREFLKQVLRPLLINNEKILLIGHSLGSVIAYDTLQELSHLEHHPGKIDLFLTIGSPLGMNYVQRRLVGHKYNGRQKYPTNIRRWVNISAVGDTTALDRVIGDDFGQMLDLGIIDAIEDYCEGIYNFYRNEEGLNCHRSYGYLVNPVVGKVIAKWWQDCQ